MPFLFGHTSRLRDRVGCDLGEAARRASNGLRMLAGHDEITLGHTPRHAVWRRDRVTLWHYPSGSRQRGVPVLIVMSLVTTPAIFDLRPGMSFVEVLQQAGFDVYVLDWGVPDVVDAGNTVESYIDEYIPRAARAVLQHAGTDGLSLLGYCLGGTLCLLTAAGHPDLPVTSMVLVSTPIDFTQMGPVSDLLLRVDIDQVLDETGNVAPSVVANAIKVVKPTGDITTWLNLWDSLPHHAVLTAHRALMTWASGHIPFPGAAAKQLADLFVRRNLLAAGAVPLGGRMVDLSAITCPVLNLHGDKDNLVPPAANAPLRRVLANADLTDVPVRTGHVGLFFGRQATKVAIPTMVSWMSRHSPAEEDE